MSDQQRDGAFILSSLIALGVFAGLPREAPLWLRVLPAILSMVVAVLAVRSSSRACSVPVLSSALLCTWLFNLHWQAVMVLSIAACLVAKRFVTQFPAILPTRGTIPVLGTFTCGAVTPFALVAWVWLQKPDLTNITSAIPRAPLVWLIAGGVAFAVINAVLEEWIWRGIIQAELMRMFAVSTAITLQALSFGSVHAHGFPSGIVGVTLATVWALILGLLRAKSGGVLAPTLAHIVADASIATIVIARLP